MDRLKKVKTIIIIFLLISMPVWALAVDGKPDYEFTITEPVIRISSDTSLPAKRDIEKPKEKPVENLVEKPVVIVIKEVPLARKQAIPVPVKVKINPVKVIKPKITVIKPVIKIVH